LRKSDVIVLDMSVDAALKYIISMGVVSPDSNARRNGRAPPKTDAVRQAVNQ